MAQNDDPTPEPDFAIFAREIVGAALGHVRTAYPARVLAYYPPDPVLKDPAMVDVQIARKYSRVIDHPADVKTGETPREDREHGTLAVADLKPIPRVVVHYPGFGGMRLTGPLLPGEEGLLITCDRSIDRWVRRGSVPVQDPVFRHKMNWKDSIFLPGLRAGADVGFDVVPEAAWRLGSDDGTWGLTVDAATRNVALENGVARVDIGGPNIPPQKGVARLGDQVAASTAMSTVLSALVAAVNFLSPGTVTPPQLAAALAQLGQISTASTRVGAAD